MDIIYISFFWCCIFLFVNIRIWQQDPPEQPIKYSWYWLFLECSLILQLVKTALGFLAQEQ